MKPFRRFVLSVLLLTSVLSACSSTAVPQEITEPEPAAGPSETIKSPQPTPTRVTMPEQNSVNPTAATPSEPTEIARQDLAQRLGVSPDSVAVDIVIGQEFSVDAFYCRTSKERIAREESPQVISGLNILLRVSGRRYEYHASDQEVVFCRPLD